MYVEQFNCTIYFFAFKIIQIQPPGEPLEHHLGEVRQGISKSTFDIYLTSLITNEILKLSRQFQQRNTIIQG